jgi:hypothetical protein
MELADHPIRVRADSLREGAACTGLLVPISLVWSSVFEQYPAANVPGTDADYVGTAIRRNAGADIAFKNGITGGQSSRSKLNLTICGIKS